MEEGSQSHHLRPNMLCSISKNHLDQVASAVYATECYLDFQKHANEYGIASHFSSQDPRPETVVQMPPNQSSTYDIVTESNLQPILKPYFCSNQLYKSFEMFQNSLSCIDARGSDFLIQDNIELLPGNSTLIGTSLQHPSDDGQNNPEKLTFSSEREKSSSSRDLEAASTTSSSISASSGPSLPSTKRIRWTQELHEKFINSVNILGGSEKATPKAILKIMESKELTIFQVKSHLQKYRADKYMSESKKGKTEGTSVDIPQLYMNNSMQIKEALQLQLDVEKHLYEQLKIQRQLQLKIEENEKQLKKMMQHQQEINNNL